MRRTRLRGAAWLAALTMIGVACSGAPQSATDDTTDVAIDNEAGGDDGGADDGGTTGEPADDATDGDATDGAEGAADDTSSDGGDGTAPGEPTTGADGGSATTGDSDGDTSGGDTSGGDTSGGDTTTAGATTTDGSSDGGPETVTGPYSAEEARVGITEDSIYMCGHAALIFAEAFDVREADLNVYWEMVNREQGGVHGREVTIDWEDDAYNGNQAITAAQTCNSRDPFVLLGGIGFDQIPGVRTWAENNAVPYIHHIAVEPDDPVTHSFSFLPSVERLGLAFGEYIATRHGGKKVGIIALESENWTPGHDAAVAEMERRGVEIVHDFEGPRKGAYQSEIFQMQQSGVEVVWVWENALASGDIIEQANQQQYFPTWVVFPFQTTLDIAQARSPIEGVSTWPAYAPGGFGENDPVGHNADIAAFEAAFAKYRPSTEPNYLLYLTWVAHKATHQLLLDCGPACDRNRLHSLLTSGYTQGPDQSQLWRPNCRVDFSRNGSFGGHYGGFTYYAQQVYDHRDGTKRFRTSEYCTTGFG